MTGFDRYGADVLAADPHAAPEIRRVSAEPGLVVEESGGWCGAVVRVEQGTVSLEDRHGRVRVFPLGLGYRLEGERIALVAPPRRGPAAPTHTASGSLAVAGARARVARGSRIFVEGRHDAELVEKVWGDDLRIEGVVVEYLAGVDDLTGHLRDFGPGPTRRVGVLVDHLVPGSKESRIAAQAATSPDVLIVGHPYVDVWAAVKPARLGLDAWPDVPRGQDWKAGVCRALGWPHADQRDIAHAWRRILAAVLSYQDLEPALLGRVEELIDFVTAPA